MTADHCPIEFNFDPATFKPGDMVSYRVTGALAGFPFAGILLEVHEDHVILTSNIEAPDERMKATRDSRPVVDECEVA
jgi:hypothetical protein